MWLWIVLVVLAVMARACYPEYEKFNVVKMKVISDE